MYFVFNKSHMFVRLNLVANLMYIIYINNTLPLATDLYMKLYTELGRLWSDTSEVFVYMIHLQNTSRNTCLTKCIFSTNNKTKMNAHISRVGG